MTDVPLGSRRVPVRRRPGHAARRADRGSGLAAAALVAARRVGSRRAWVAAALLWSLAVIGMRHADPAERRPGHLPAEGQHATCCSWDIGGPSPGRVLDLRRRPAAAQHPAVRARRGVPGAGVRRAGGPAWVLIPLGLVALAAYSAGHRGDPARTSPASTAPATSPTSSTTSPVPLIGVVHRARAAAAVPALAGAAGAGADPRR